MWGHRSKGLSYCSRGLLGTQAVVGGHLSTLPGGHLGAPELVVGLNGTPHVTDIATKNVRKVIYFTHYQNKASAKHRALLFSTSGLVSFFVSMCFFFSVHQRIMPFQTVTGPVLKSGV